MKKIILISILLVITVLAYSQEIQDAWETWLEIDDNPLGSLSAWLDQPPIQQITFAEKLGTIKFRSGKEQHFAWEQGTSILTVLYLTKKQEFFVADPESLFIEYVLIDENTLLLGWEFQNDFSVYYLILKRVNRVGDPPDLSP